MISVTGSSLTLFRFSRSTEATLGVRGLGFIDRGVVGQGEIVGGTPALLLAAFDHRADRSLVLRPRMNRRVLRHLRCHGLLHLDAGENLLELRSEERRVGK